MATELQKKGIIALSENARNRGKALRKAGYSKTSSEKPKRILKSKGFQELLIEAGLTDKFLNSALYDDIKKKKKNRKPELELAYKLKGRMTDKVDLTSKGKSIGLFDYTLDKKNE